MRRLKIRKSLWDKIVSGEKKWEFRKTSKGLTSEVYEFVSIERADHPRIKGDKSSAVPKEIYGTAKLNLMGANTTLRDSGKPDYEFFNNGWKDVDRETYYFVKENYVDKHDFAVFWISEVKCDQVKEL